MGQKGESKMSPQDYSEEKKPVIKMLLPAGWRVFDIVNCSEEVFSSKGNLQYITTLADLKTGYEDTIYLVNVKGKRWVLKSICEASGVDRDEQGKFLFEPPAAPPIKGKRVLGFVVHEPNEYTNRNNEKIKTIQHKIVEFKVYHAPASGNPEDAITQWDE